MGRVRTTVGIGILALAVPSPAVAAACPAVGTETTIVTAVESRLELRLADGRRLRLAGLDPATSTPSHPDLDETTRSRFAATLAGKPVSLTVLAGTPDRWGRLAALVFAGGAPGGLAVDAIAAGLGRYLAEPIAAACRHASLDAERQARAAKLGLWNDPYYGVLAVDDLSGLAERSATLVLAEGRLAELRSGPYRTTLRFATPGRPSHPGHMLVATIAPRTMKSFETQRVDMKALVGRRLRIRGLLDLRFGPRIELRSQDQIEILDAPSTAVSGASASGSAD